MVVDRFEAARPFNYDPSQLLERCEEVVHFCGFKVQRVDPTTGFIFAKTRMSWQSWGENIVISVSKDGTVGMRSSCLFKGARMDWGKNRQNVYKFFDNLSIWLGEPLTGSLVQIGRVNYHRGNE